MVSLILNSIRCPEPFEAYVLPVSGYPLPDEECRHLGDFARRFLSGAATAHKLTPEVFMQLEQLVAPDSRTTFSAHGKAWMPQTGLGVWVDREPPKKWTREEVMQLVPGDKMRPIMFQVFRVSNPEPARTSAASAMFRYGSVLQVLAASSTDYLAAVKPIFKEGITDPSYTCFRYYVGLMEGKTMATATREQLDRWFTGMSIYFRQSFEDRGILIASAVPLGHIFESLGAKRSQTGWTLTA